jgi:2-C-methyl-D-erythritol 2,4-cyclodiphosphate synthase
MTPTRTGLGFDSHPADPTRPLFLGGIQFDGEPGLAGHSDGDAVCHALADALLGAAGAGDVGTHFPEDDPALEGISGIDLLGKTVQILAGLGVAPLHCDMVVICDRPSIAPAAERMRKLLAETIGVEPTRVSIKATRPEGLGLAGDGAGCLAIASVG